MLTMLRGKVFSKGSETVYLDVSGHVYEIFVSIRTTPRLPDAGSDLNLLVHVHKTEDADTMYGFLDEEEREFFKLLRTASGVGPKTAIRLLGLAPIPNLKQAIRMGNESFLRMAKGLGEKGAKNLILDLGKKCRE